MSSHVTDNLAARPIDRIMPFVPVINDVESVDNKLVRPYPRQTGSNATCLKFLAVLHKMAVIIHTAVRMNKLNDVSALTVLKKKND